ncbi:MAG: TatD family hydrolase [Chloroflexi bacterium]|nr:TatD family hydrolase [Chloroflexota bacterium]
MIDAHAHLTDARFSSDLDAVLDRAASAGVDRILACGEDVVSSERAVTLAARSSGVRVAVGIHPHRAPAADAQALRRIRELASAPSVVAVGEIGIDLSGRSAPRPDQERALLAQLELAADADLPVCLHVRDSGPVVRALVDRVTGVRGYVHCYSEGPAEVDEWVARGFLMSLSGTVTYPRSEPLRAAAALIPSDRLLIETDAPSLAPQPRRGRRNEPAFVAFTYEEVARIRGVTPTRLAELVRENAASLFGARW